MPRVPRTSHRPSWPWVLWLLLVWPILLAPARSTAQTVISLDGSLPNGRTDVISDLQPGPSYVVTEADGWLVQSPSNTNLFHSFLQLDVGAGDRVTFTATTPGISNVIARVTGGDVSDIDGVIESQIAGADFFLLNPAGILFGPASSIDVPASLYIGTATDLIFENGESLDLVDATDPVLSVAAPEAFGFGGGAAAAPVEIASAAGSPVFAVPDGESLTVIAGDVEAYGNRTLRARGGRIQLVGVGAAVIDVPIGDVGDAVLGPGSPLGVVSITNQTTLSTENAADPTGSQGTIVIRGGRFELADRARLRAAGDPASGLSAIDIEVTGEADVRTQASITVLNAESATGETRIAASLLRVRDGGVVQSVMSGTDDGSGSQTLGGGAVRLVAGTIEVTGGGQVVTSTQPVSGQAGDGRGSDLVLTADRIEVSADGGVGTFAFAGGGGGNLTLEAPDIEVATGGDVQTSATGAGRGGALTLEAGGGAVRVVDGGVITTVATGAAVGGDITVTAGTIEVLDGGLDNGVTTRSSAIESITGGAGATGAITLTTGDLRAGRSAGSDRAGRIATAVQNGATGSSGDITIAADGVTLDGGGQISTTTLGQGNSGLIQITATNDVVFTGDDIADDGLSVLSSGAFTRAGTSGSVSAADAGSVTITAQNIDVLGGAEISTQAIGSGTSGSIALTAQGRVRVAGQTGQPSQVSARALEGQGGNVAITADVVEVLDGGRVDVSTFGAGDGGQLTVNAGDLLVSGAGAVLTAQANGAGDAQGIQVDATRSVQIEDGGVVTAEADILLADGSPGDISIRAPSITISGGESSTEAGSAAGGDLTLEGADEVNIVDGAVLEVRSATGDAGNLTITSRNVLIRESTVLAEAFDFGGGVTIRGSETVQIDGALIEASSNNAGKPDESGDFAGGNISVEGGSVALNASTLDAEGNGKANGGNVLLAGDALAVSTNSEIDFSSVFREQGSFTQEGPNALLAGKLTALPENFLDASALLETPCLARRTTSGSFAVRRSAPLPPSPDAPLEPEPEEPPGIPLDAGAGCAP